MRVFTIQLTHRPGGLADVANALSLKGVNIKSLAALNLGNQDLMRLIPDELDAARNALHDRNIRFEENKVMKHWVGPVNFWAFPLYPRIAAGAATLPNVPEPSTLVLFALTFAVIAQRRRR